MSFSSLSDFECQKSHSSKHIQVAHTNSCGIIDSLQEPFKIWESSKVAPEAWRNFVCTGSTWWWATSSDRVGMAKNCCCFNMLQHISMGYQLSQLANWFCPSAVPQVSYTYGCWGVQPRRWGDWEAFDHSTSLVTDFLATSVQLRPFPTSFRFFRSRIAAWSPQVQVAPARPRTQGFQVRHKRRGSMDQM